MEAGRCIKILDPYDWLPGYGENAVKTIMDRDLTLTVFVSYDGENGEEQEKKIIFKGVYDFHRSSWPGVDTLNISRNGRENEDVSIFDLIEYPDSEAALAWNNYWEKCLRSSGVSIKSSIKHYRWAFRAENVMLEIFAKSVQLEEENVHS